MQIELGAPVLTSDGQDAGRIDKLILDARRLVASAVVLRQGGLLHKDIQAPLSELAVSPTGDLLLTYTADIVRDMPTYSPPGSGGFGSDAGVSADTAAMLAQYELEHAVIGAGSAVKAHDGKKVGAVHRLAFELPGGRPTRLIIRRGLLVAEEVELPVALLAGAGQGELALSIPADEVEALVKLRPGLDVYASDEVCLGSVVTRYGEHVQVSGVDGRHPPFVPLAAVRQVAADRVVLAVDSGQAALWRSLPEAAAAAELRPLHPEPPADGAVGS
jgi:hypothetical protein